MLADTTGGMKVINIARDFTRFPAGRYKADGEFSGEVFRERFLEPVLDHGDRAVIELDGALGYGSSFLEEAFGGLIRKGYSKEAVKAAFEFKTTDKSLVWEIDSYIEGGSTG